MCHPSMDGGNHILPQGRHLCGKPRPQRRVWPPDQLAPRFALSDARQFSGRHTLSLSLSWPDPAPAPSPLLDLPDAARTCFPRRSVGPTFGLRRTFGASFAPQRICPEVERRRRGLTLLPRDSPSKYVPSEGGRGDDVLDTYSTTTPRLTGVEIDAAKLLEHFSQEQFLDQRSHVRCQVRPNFGQVGSASANVDQFRLKIGHL